MSNYKVKDNKVAFHPGYYLKEYLEESNMSLCDFAKLLDINIIELTNIVNGERNLNIENATKIANYMGTSVEYWMNLQNGYNLILNKE